MWRELNERLLREDLQRVLDRGITCLSIVLMHSYTYAFTYIITPSPHHTLTCRYAEHEERVRYVAMEMGFTHVSLSSVVMPMVRIVQRGFTGEPHTLTTHPPSHFLTACADGYLTPCIYRYVQGFISGFKNTVSVTSLTYHTSHASHITHSTGQDKLRVLFMQSDGGLTPMNKYVPSHTLTLYTPSHTPPTTTDLTAVEQSSQVLQEVW